MAEPSKTDIAAALKRAQVMFRHHPEWDLLRALAEATTSEQCGVLAHKVFRDARDYLADVSGVAVTDLNGHDRDQVLGVLESAFLVAAS